MTEHHSPDLRALELKAPSKKVSISDKVYTKSNPDHPFFNPMSEEIQIPSDVPTVAFQTDAPGVMSDPRVSQKTRASSLYSPKAMPPKSSLQGSSPIAVSCQDILKDNKHWTEVAIKIKEDWRRCLDEVQCLETKISEDRQRRKLWAWRLRTGGFFLMGFQNIIAGATAMFPFFRWGIPVGVTYGMSIFTFILSLTFWSHLGERSKKYLIEAKDLERVESLCAVVRRKLKETIADGRISEKERELIRSMIGEIHKKAEEISSMGLLINILGDTPYDTFDHPEKKNDYHKAVSSIRDIIGEVSRTHDVIESKIPHVVREYRDAQLQLQIHSIANPFIPQRIPGDQIDL